MEKLYTIRFNCVFLPRKANDRVYVKVLNKGAVHLGMEQIPRITDVDGMCFDYYDHSYKGYIPEANQILKYKISA